MVNFTKWVVIAAGLVFLGLFTQEAAATGLTGTLQRTGLSGQSIGGGLAAIGRGGGAGVSGLLSPFWEIRNIIRGFMNLGSATPWLEDSSKQGGGTDSSSGEGGGYDSLPQSIELGSPDFYTGAGFSYYQNQPSTPAPNYSLTPSLPQTVSLPSIYGGQYVPPTQGGGTTPQAGGGGGMGHNVSTPSGGVASGNLSLGSWN